MIPTLGHNRASSKSFTYKFKPWFELGAIWSNHSNCPPPTIDTFELFQDNGFQRSFKCPTLHAWNLCFGLHVSLKSQCRTSQYWRGISCRITNVIFSLLSATNQVAMSTNRLLVLKIFWGKFWWRLRSNYSRFLPALGDWTAHKFFIISKL